MATKESLIAQGKWDVFKDKPYENSIVQASQSSNIFRSIQTMGDLEKDGSASGQSEARPASQGSGSTSTGSGDALQELFMTRKEAFCVVEEMVKYLGSKGHHLSHAYGVGYAYLERMRPLIS